MSSNNTATKILVTGGTGKTGYQVVEQLRGAGVSPIIASRSPRKSDEIRFDWFDPATFVVAKGIDAAYLVPPTAGASDPLQAMRPFIDHALEAGVQRFVLLGNSVQQEGDSLSGAVHAYLKAHAPRWAVLRPTWFMQNFSVEPHIKSIREENVIYSAAGDGVVGFADARDIAAVGVAALLDPAFPNRDVLITGPQTLSHDQVASILSEVLERPIVHRRLSKEELVKHFEARGMSTDYAQFKAFLDTKIAEGVGDIHSSGVLDTIGRNPGSFIDFARRDADTWRV